MYRRYYGLVLDSQRIIKRKRNDKPWLSESITETENQILEPLERPSEISLEIVIGYVCCAALAVLWVQSGMWSASLVGPERDVVSEPRGIFPNYRLKVVPSII